jgi:hypothetical protein
MRRWTREAAIEWLQERGDELGHTPRLIDMIPYHMTFHRLFGGIQKAQIAAGFRPNKPGRPRKVDRA